MGAIKIVNGKLVNEGCIEQKDILIFKDRIEKISNSIKTPQNVKVFDANGKYIIPGLIDDQVHFREPGLTHKATIESESKAAIAEELLEKVWPLFSDGQIKPVIDSVFPLSDAASAHERMETSSHIGKIILQIGSD